MSTSSNKSMCRSLQVVQELALVMYAALDIGLKEDEERTLSPGMENLLAHMISAGRHMEIQTRPNSSDLVQTRPNLSDLFQVKEFLTKV